MADSSVLKSDKLEQPFVYLEAPSFVQEQNENAVGARQKTRDQRSEDDDAPRLLGRGGVAYRPGEVLLNSAVLSASSVAPWPMMATTLPGGALGSDEYFTSLQYASGVTAPAACPTAGWESDGSTVDTSPEASYCDSAFPDVPTVGSRGHFTGTCKPCAFVFKAGQGGCLSGYECKFCHLCGPGEKKRRKKVWRVQRWCGPFQDGYAAPAGLPVSANPQRQ
eukprot:TRINITY_DN27775_c0_g2_i1.p1 TRINITY_DN27775_c0_g2~~TRINITY_DN27775_c0_g2_i1.p1  ORF type:complete len:240 (-),score=32.34 TRINITY_DN27775_c0_g2_i1:452-1114(-)